MRIVRMAMLVLVGIVIAGAAGAAYVVMNRPPGTTLHIPGLSSGGTVDDPTVGLTSAEHSDCSQQGLTVATYLSTGSPTSLDQNFASSRAEILSKPAAARPGLIRSIADSVITRCDQQENQQAADQAAATAAQASADAAAAAKAQHDATRAADLAQDAATCRRVGGTWHADVPTCKVDYPASLDSSVIYHYDVYFAADGSIAPQPESPQNAAQCSSATGGHGRWHPDTGICAI